MVRVLVCIDDSELSEAAVPAARAIAEADGEVELFHVIVPGTAERGEPWSGSARSEEEKRKATVETRRADAEAHLRRVAATAGSRVSTAIVEAPDAARAIIDRAQTEHPDVIALATRSTEVMGKPHLGSVAERVTLSGVAPVLLVSPVEQHSVRLDALSRGSFVFTADGVELGRVGEVKKGAFSLERDESGALWFAASAVKAINTGRVILHYDHAEVARHSIKAPPAGAASND